MAPPGDKRSEIQKQLEALFGVKLDRPPAVKSPVRQEPPDQPDVDEDIDDEYLDDDDDIDEDSAGFARTVPAPPPAREEVPGTRTFRVRFPDDPAPPALAPGGEPPAPPQLSPRELAWQQRRAAWAAELEEWIDSVERDPESA